MRMAWDEYLAAASNRGAAIPKPTIDSDLSEVAVLEQRDLHEASTYNSDADRRRIGNRERPGPFFASPIQEFEFAAEGAMYLRHGEHTFEIRLEPIDPRPDETWSYVDPLGHRHQWEWPDGRRVYQPDQPAAVVTCGAMQHTTIIEGEEVRQLRYE